MRILNGRTKGDRMGKITRYPLSLRETPSTLDYMIVDTETLKNIKYFSVLPHLGLSDHQCLPVQLTTGGFSEELIEVNVLKESPFKYASNEEFLLKLMPLLYGKNLISLYMSTDLSLTVAPRRTVRGKIGKIKIIMVKKVKQIRFRGTRLNIVAHKLALKLQSDCSFDVVLPYLTF